MDKAVGKRGRIRLKQGLDCTFARANGEGNNRHMRVALIPALAAVLAVALTLGACGRKGPLERPKSATVTNPDGTVTRAPDIPDRPFILDRLLR